MTKQHDMTNNESAFFDTTFCAKHHSSEEVSIGWVEEDMRGKDGTISFQIIYWNKKSPELEIVEVHSINLNDEEIGLTIKGLQKARQHLRKLNKDVPIEPVKMVTVEGVLFVANQMRPDCTIISLESLQELANSNPARFRLEGNKLIARASIFVRETRNKPTDLILPEKKGV